MKTLLILATIFGFSLSSQASSRVYSCPQELGYSPLKPGAQTKKVVEVYSTTNPKYQVVKVYDEVLATGRRTLTREELASVQTEDVIYDLRARGLFVRIYLDELNESYVKLGNNETIHVDCTPKR